MCECCVAPILILIISMFYKKDEQVSLVVGVNELVLTFLQGVRVSWFYVMVRVFSIALYHWLTWFRDRMVHMHVGCPLGYNILTFI